MVVDKITLAAASTGVSVSAWLPSAAMRQLDEQARLEIGRIEAAARVADHEAEHGPIRPEVTRNCPWCPPSCSAGYGAGAGRRGASVDSSGDAGCTHVLDAVTAKQGGQLCGVAGTSDLADRVVAVLAVRHGADVVTSHPDDMGPLLDAAGRRLPIFAVCAPSTGEHRSSRVETGVATTGRWRR